MLANILKIATMSVLSFEYSVSGLTYAPSFSAQSSIDSADEGARDRFAEGLKQRNDVFDYIEELEAKEDFIDKWLQDGITEMGDVSGALLGTENAMLWAGLVMYGVHQEVIDLVHQKAMMRYYQPVVLNNTLGCPCTDCILHTAPGQYLRVPVTRWLPSPFLTYKKNDIWMR